MFNKRPRRPRWRGEIIKAIFELGPLGHYGVRCILHLNFCGLRGILFYICSDSSVNDNGPIRLDPDHPGALRVHAADASQGACGCRSEHGLRDAGGARLPRGDRLDHREPAVGAREVRRLLPPVLAALLLAACVGPKPEVRSAFSKSF